MKILWVKAGKLLPVDTGGKIRSFNILRHLARDHEVVFLSYYGGRHDPAYEAAITPQLPGAQTLHVTAPEGGLAQAVDYILKLHSPAPYAVKKFTHGKVREKVALAAARRSFSAQRGDRALAADGPYRKKSLAEALVWHRSPENGTLRNSLASKISARSCGF